MSACSVELVAAADPLVALDRLVTLATPVLASHGFAVEARGRDWAHWTCGFQNVIRAYAFQEAGEGGVRLVAQGEIPDGLIDDVATRVASAPGVGTPPAGH
jgi:hypothetical protein